MSKHPKQGSLDPTIEMEEWVSPAQAARILGVTTARVRQLALAGRLPFTQTPMGRIFAREEIERLAASRQSTTKKGEKKE